MTAATRRATAPAPRTDQTEQDALTRAFPRRATAPSTFESSGHRRRYTLFQTQSTRIPLQLTATSPSRMALEPGTVEGFRHLAHSIVSRTLAVECEYARRGRPEQAESDWKLHKKHNHLVVYKRRRVQRVAPLDQPRGAATSSSLEKPPTVLCVGSVEGTIEDILYGVHAKTRREVGATMAFLGRTPLDCDVLAVLERGTDADPFRHLSVKYLLTAICGDTRVVNNRDVCALESMGVGHDAQGERYGYYLLRSISVPECSPLPEDSGVVRASVTMCCIYRQGPGTTVHVYSKAMTDLGGALPGFIAYDAAADLLLSNAEAVNSATAKRLTALALRHARFRPSKAEEAEDLTASSTSELPSNASPCAKPFDMQSPTSPSSTAPTVVSDAHATAAHKPLVQPCSVCGKKPMMARLVHSSQRTCGVCDHYVCSKCSVKQILYARLEPVAVACCKACLLAAKQLVVDPRDPFPMVGYQTR
ncbi:unnamed protein product [Hyaloperonospora brassicae]|uniref:FYVE-type domain-containing protein n=1 Tax=Hyaloperonospora brassicae TaxID=162125 RepID=A0AAV0TA56_HYABA|nr:unnamed protein product [Hyaloperonospora brassicae]